MRNINHLCIVADNYPTASDPTFPFVEQLAEAMVKYGMDVTVIAPQSVMKCIAGKGKFHPRQVSKQIGKNTLTVFQPYCISFSTHTPKINFWSRRRAVEKCFERISHKPDVCYGHFWHSGYYIYRKAKRYKLPLFVATGESVIHFRADSEEKKRFCRYVSGVVCVSTKNKTESIEKGLTIAERCSIFPNAIDNTLFKQLNRDECRSALNVKKDDFVVAFIGWFSERKGSVRVSDAIKQLDNDNIKSIFIGTGPVEFTPQCDNIIFKGRVSHNNIPRYLNAADVFVLPTLNEGCCNAIIEAMACGLPIISSNLPFNHDVLNDSNSLMLNPYDVDAIAGAIERLYNNRGLVTSLSAGALAKAEELTIEQRAHAILQFIRRCV